MGLIGLWTSKSALAAQQEKLDCISNNIANASTLGYKREEVSFQDLVYDKLERAGIPTAKDAKTALINGSGVKVGIALRDTTQGSMLTTGVSTDFALDGKGYFRVIKQDGSFAYERNGSFSVDGTGKLVDKGGNILEIQYTEDGNKINAAGGLSADNFSVDQTGVITVKQGASSVDYGKINVYNVTGNDSMLSVGNDLYVPVQGANIYSENGTNVLQGYLENSNVDMSKEMADMIIAQRSFQLGSKGISTADEMWGLINNMKK
ncbi:MAG: flagellar hook-basal body complex protein [Solirubrobacterales bacterium]